MFKSLMAIALCLGLVTSACADNETSFINSDMDIAETSPVVITDEVESQALPELPVVAEPEAACISEEPLSSYAEPRSE